MAPDLFLYLVFLRRASSSQIFGQLLRSAARKRSTCFGYRSPAVDRVIYLINPVLRGTSADV
jgi:hypothetical protein